MSGNKDQFEDEEFDDDGFQNSRNRDGGFDDDGFQDSGRQDDGFDDDDGFSGGDQLGSLSQDARLKQLKAARSTLFFVGFLTLAVHLFSFANAEKQLNKQVQKQAPGMQVDPVAFQRELTLRRIISGGLAAVGLAFVIIGVLIKSAPVPMTIIALVLYIAVNGILGFIAPASLMSGIVFKLIVIAVLGKAVQAAIAYQREHDESAAFAK
jgi:hypothetical protein